MGRSLLRSRGRQCGRRLSGPGSGEATPPARNADGTVSSGIGEADGEMLDHLAAAMRRTPQLLLANGRGALGRDGLINANEAHNGPEFSVAHGNGGAELPEDFLVSDGGTPRCWMRPSDPTLDNGLPGATDFVPKHRSGGQR